MIIGFCKHPTSPALAYPEKSMPDRTYPKIPTPRPITQCDEINCQAVPLLLHDCTPAETDMVLLMDRHMHCSTTHPLVDTVIERFMSSSLFHYSEETSIWLVGEPTIMAAVVIKEEEETAGLSGNMIYHRYVITLQLWYNKHSNYMSLWYITLDIVHPFFRLQHGLLSAPPTPQCPQHWLTPGKFCSRHTACPFPKWHNGLAPAIPYWGAVCHYPAFSGHSILRVMCNLSDSISLSPCSTPFHPIFPLLLILFRPNLA